MPDAWLSPSSNPQFGFFHIRKNPDTDEYDAFDHILRLGNPFLSHIDTKNIFLMGHSMGGATVITSAYILTNYFTKNKDLISQNFNLNWNWQTKHAKFCNVFFLFLFFYFFFIFLCVFYCKPYTHTQHTNTR